jgi:putative peptidoglycan lipid II flippase
MGPVLFGIGIYYLDVMLARRFLSELEVGSQSYFGWALRLCDFPQGIFVMALQTATLPSLSRLVARGDRREVEETFSFALRLTIFVGLTASIAAFALAEPLTILIFQRGYFDSVSSRETAKALAAQGCGIWMVATVRQLVAVYYAHGDTRAPVRVAAIDLCVFIGLALILRGPFGHVGVSMAVTGSSFVQMVLLALGLRKRLPTLDYRPIVVSTGKTLFAAIIAGILARTVSNQLTQLQLEGSIQRALPGAFAIIVYATVFLTIAFATKNDALLTLLTGLRRKRRSTSA